MRYKVDGKNISIPDVYIDTQMKKLGISRQEAVDMYLSDEDLVVNPEVIALTQKAKAAGTGAKATGEKTARKPPERKPDDIKRAIIAGLAEYIDGVDGVSGLEVTNIERMVAFEYDGEKYELTLTRKRKPKK